MLHVLFPIFGIFSLGYIAQKITRFDIKSISKMAFYLMSPMLAFKTFYTNPLTMQHLYMGIFLLSLLLALILIICLIGWIRQYRQPEICGLILAAAFMNNGNFGTPVALFLFGDHVLDIAIALMVLQALLTNTVGVYVGAQGSPTTDGIRSALNAVKKAPIVYGALIGLAFQYLHIPLSKPIQAAVDLVANGAIPTIMILLGMQLATIKLNKIAPAKLVLSLTIKLFLSPLVALLITFILPVEPLTKQVMIIMAAMPTAVQTTIVAMQYHTEPHLVSSTTLFSSCLSIFTLPIIFTLL